MATRTPRAASAAAVAAAFLLALGAAAAAPAQLPPELKTCKQTDPQYNDCLKNALQGALPSLSKGIRSLEAQPIDPLTITSLSISEEKDKPVAINLDFSNFQITGISSAIIDSFEMTPGSYDMKIKAHTTGPLTLTGKYKIDGKVLVLPIQGEGDCKLIADNIDALLDLKGVPLEKDGHTHADIKDFKFSFETKKMTFDFSNLFNGDKALGDNMNKFLNENWEEILKELKPSIEEAFGLAFKDIANNVFHKVPYTDVFPTN
ncbi:protein takeout-like [Schistocerca americana]|uniref:protein takeout-like n=1 Tax=Schistocerca americana TaxID=7009 RepID=UPI001F5019A0|nr:protein takeout-like [Schistocerca americana]